MTAVKRFRLAAALLVVSAIGGLLSAIRILAAGSAGLPPLPGAEEMGGPPFWAGLMFFALAVASLFAAYGLWKGQRWGKVVAIVTCAINAVFAAGDVLTSVMIGSLLLGILMTASVLGHLLVIALVLWRERASAPATVVA